MATDAAALAGARLTDATLARRQSMAQSVFDANYPQASESNFELSMAPSGKSVKVLASHQVPTVLMKLMGTESVTVHAEAEVPLATVGFAEIALVLDYSDSMIDSDKYVRMYEAASKLVDAISENGTNTHVKAALVPFSAVVRADIPAGFIRSDVTYDGCTMDRQHPYNITEGTTTAGDAAKWGDHSVGGHDCSVVAAANLKVLPLTSDITTVKTTLSSFQPHLWTHIAAGVEFGWQVLSPDGVFGGARQYDHGQNVKVMVLLTDGMQTAPGWGPGGSRTVAEAESNLLSMCASMKAKGIQIYTIGYDLTDTHTLSLLTQCATPDQHFASTDLDNGLANIMNDIAIQVRATMMRLSK